MIPYVYPKPPLVLQHPSHSRMFSGNLANHWHHRGLRYSWSTSERSTNNNPFAVHTDRVNSYSPNHPRVVTDPLSSSQIKPPRRSRIMVLSLAQEGQGRREMDVGPDYACNHYGPALQGAEYGRVAEGDYALFWFRIH